MLTYGSEKYLNVQRYGYSRMSRYLSQPHVEAECNPIIKSILGKQIPTRYAKYIRSSFDERASGIIGVLENDEYAMVFINDEGLDVCALQITFNLQDRALIRHFCSSCTDDQMDLLIKVCRKITFDRQRAKLLKNEDTEFVIYSQYPNDDWYPNKPIRYVDHKSASKVVDNQSFRLIVDCFSRGISYKTVSEIYPLDYPALFMARPLTDFEAAQIIALDSNYQAACI